MAAAAKAVEACLKCRLEGQQAPPALAEAMAYALLGGGKRFRPFLVIETAALFGVAAERAKYAGAALECIHCYSLVHDDLPAMDDDDLRRGRASVHKKFDEATAILVGDGLQSLAFEIMADEACHRDPGVRAELVIRLAKASGAAGMAGGQALDLAAERRSDIGLEQIQRIQSLKTGALILFACEAGAILGAGTDDQRQALRRFGETLGVAFQIKDDLLDLEGDEALVGKRTNKDASAGKATFASLLGLEGAREQLAMLEERAIAALEGFGPAAHALREAVRFAVRRER